MEFQYRDEPNQKVLAAGGAAFLMPQHCSFLCPASHSCFIKTSFLYFWYPYFCCWGEAALVLKSATNENCPWHFKPFLFIPETATSRQKWQWAMPGCVSATSACGLTTNFTLPSQFKPRSWALPGAISTYPFPATSATAATTFR